MMISAALVLSFLAASDVETLEVDGVKRTFEVTVPSGKAPESGYPVVFVFHGHGGNIRSFKSKVKMSESWPEAVVVMMQGLPAPGKNDPDGKRNGWQKNLGELGDRDLKFFDSAFSKISKDYQLDNKRIYAMGHSNGGRFTYLLWSQRGDKFAAYGVVASPAAGLYSTMKPNHIFHVAGKADQTVPFASQWSTIQTLSKLLGCPEEPKETKGNLSLFHGSSGYDLATWIHDGGHSVPDASITAMVKFFQQHAKP